MPILVRAMAGQLCYALQHRLHTDLQPCRLFCCTRSAPNINQLLAILAAPSTLHSLFWGRAWSWCTLQTDLTCTLDIYTFLLPWGARHPLSNTISEAQAQGRHMVPLLQEHS